MDEGQPTSIDVEVVGRIAEVVPVALDDEEDEEEEEEEEDEGEDMGKMIDGSALPSTLTSSLNKRKHHVVIEDVYRGVVGEDTDIFVLLENNDIPWILTHAPPVCTNVIN